MSGLTLGLMSLDVVDLEVTLLLDPCTCDTTSQLECYLCFVLVQTLHSCAKPSAYCRYWCAVARQMKKDMLKGYSQ